MADKNFAQRKKAALEGKSIDGVEGKMQTLKTALIQTAGNITKACELIGITTQTFYNWNNKHPEIEQFLMEALKSADLLALSYTLAKLKSDPLTLQDYRESRLGRFGLSKRTHFVKMKKKLGSLKTAEDVNIAHDKVLEGMDTQEISIETGLTLSSMLENKRKSIETRELEARLEALEQRNKEIQDVNP